MGQRTQIIVIKESNDGVRDIYGFHDQWGYGRNMYLAFMDMVMEDYGKDVFRNGYEFLNAPKIATMEKVDQLVYFKDIKVKSPNVIGRCNELDRNALALLINSRCDNNNGAMVVHVKEDDIRYLPSHFKVGFLLGKEDAYSYPHEHAFGRWLTPEEYGRLNGGSAYSDDEFVRLFTDFCKYFGVEYISD